MSDTEEYDLIPHYNPYTTLAMIEECDLNSELMRSCYDDMGETSTYYDDKPIISPTSSHSSLHDELVPTPFWYDNEETTHIQHIMIWYTHQLQLRMPYERIHGERSPLIFIGSIRRHVIRSPPGTWRTLDIISTYTRDHVPLGFTMTPLSCEVAYRTTWDISEGMPIAIKKLSHVDHQHYIRHLDMTHPPSYLHAIPIFACNEFIYTCNHIEREMGYAGASAHAIHVTAQLTGMPHQLRNICDEKQPEEDEDAKYEDDDEYTHEYIPEDDEDEYADEKREDQHDSDVTDSESDSECEETRDSSSDDDLTTYRQAIIKDTFPAYKHDSSPHKHSHNHKHHYHPKQPHHYKHTSIPSKSLSLQDNEFLTACGTYDDEDDGVISDSEDVDDNDVAALAASLGLGLGMGIGARKTSCTGGWESSFRPSIRS